MRNIPLIRSRHRAAASVLSLWLLGFMLAGAFTLPAGARGDDSERWHATAYVDSPVGMRVIHYWSKGAWMRADTVVGGHPIVTVVRGKEYFVWNVATGAALRIQRAKSAIAGARKRRRSFGYEFEELLADGAEKVEDTFHMGEPVEVWRVTDKTGRRTLWTTGEAERVPLRIETFHRSSGKSVTTDYMNWQKGLALSDRFFEPPASLDIETVDHEEYVAQAMKRTLPPVLFPDLLFDRDGD